MFVLHHAARLLKAALPVIVGLSAAASLNAAITVTDVGVSAGAGNTIILKYRLNEPATNGSIQLSGGSSYSGGTAQGVNTVSLPATAATETATITATAAAEAGTGGAAIIVPATSPDNRATPASTNLVAAEINKRKGGKYDGYIYLPTGFNQDKQKYCWVYASDGSYLFNKDLYALYASTSWPLGAAVVQNDPQDRLAIMNRSTQRYIVFNPDMSQGPAMIGSGYNTIGMAITPNTDPSIADPFIVYSSGNKISALRRSRSDLTTSGGGAYIADVCGPVVAAGAGLNVHDVAVDVTNRFLFKVQVTDGGTGPINTPSNLSKWESTDNGITFEEDTTWSANFFAAVAADLSAAGSSLTVASLTGGGVSLAPGFNANSPASSWVWIAVSGGTGTAFWNRIYKVNAADGSIDANATIDVTQIPTPEGGIAFSDKAVHFVEADRAGNLLIGLNPGVYQHGQQARYFAVLGPNTAGPTSDVLTNVSLQPPLSAVATSDKAVVANTGTVPINFNVDVFNSKGIVADNVTVTGNLTQLGGAASVPLTMGTVSTDGKSASFTCTFTVPTTIDLNNSGTYDIPFTVSATSGSLVARVTETVYNAYTPKWTANVTGAVVDTEANGRNTFAATDAGKVYSFDAVTGAPNAAFGGSGSISLPVTGAIDMAHKGGLLFVGTAGGVYILNGGTGAEAAKNLSITGVKSVAAHPVDASVFYATAGNFIYKLSASTGAQLAKSADLGAAANRVAIGKTSASDGGTGMPIEYIAVCGTEGDSEGKNGKIVMLKHTDLTEAFPEITDANGPVRSRPATGTLTTSENYAGVGGTTGLFGISLDSGTKLPWVAGSNGGANTGGNPYTPTSPIESNSAIPELNSGLQEDTRILFATKGGQTANGSILVLNPANGERITFGNHTIGIAEIGTGFAEGSGIIAVRGSSLGATPVNSRVVYGGTDATDTKFVGVETMPDDVTYSATAARKHIYNPKDTAAFPGAVAGGFNTPTVLAGDVVITGSTAGKVYGFNSLTTVQPFVTSSTPANGASGVATGATITVTFNAPVDPYAAMDPYVQLILNGTPVSCMITPNDDYTAVTITPDSPLTVNRTYVVALTREVCQPYSFSFYTGTLPLTVADVKKAIDIASGLIQATTTDKARLDVDGDGSITLKDAAKINRGLSGL